MRCVSGPGLETDHLFAEKAAAKRARLQANPLAAKAARSDSPGPCAQAARRAGAARLDLKTKQQGQPAGMSAKTTKSGLLLKLVLNLHPFEFTGKLMVSGERDMDGPGRRVLDGPGRRDSDDSEDSDSSSSGISMEMASDLAGSGVPAPLPRAAKRTRAAAGTSLASELSKAEAPSTAAELTCPVPAADTSPQRTSAGSGELEIGRGAPGDCLPAPSGVIVVGVSQPPLRRRALPASADRPKPGRSILRRVSAAPGPACVPDTDTLASPPLKRRPWRAVLSRRALRLAR
jgi:hypothetical protein